MERPSSTSGTILVVDADDQAREALTDVLQDRGYRVAQAANGREGLSYLRGGQQPCVILLDLMMPVMDGWQFRAEQLQDPSLASIPVVVVTALSSAYRATTQLDAAAYIPKPFDLSVLLDAIQRYCETTG